MRRSVKLGWVTAMCGLSVAAATPHAHAQEGGSITGVVTGGPSATPLWDIPVHIVTSADGGVTVSHVTTALTNEAGEFAAQGLQPGTYYAYTEVPRAYSPHRDYIDEIYGGLQCAEPCAAKSFVMATPIVVVAGQMTAGRDFALDAGGFISGLAIDGEYGSPVNLDLFGQARLFRNNVQLRYADIAWEKVDQFGFFGLPDGAYTLHVEAQGTKTIDVALAGPRGVFARAVLTQDGQFGRFAPPNGGVGVPTPAMLSWEPHPAALGYEYCIDTNNNEGCDTSWVPVSATSATVSGLNPSTPYYWHVRAVNPTRNPPVWEAPGPWWTFTTAAPGGSISGSVTHRVTSQPLWNVTVRIVTKNADGTVTLAARAVTNENGVYTVAGLTPDTYYAYTATDGHHRAFVNEILGDIPCTAPCHTNSFESAEPIVVTSGQVAGGRDFALDRGGFISGAVFDALTGARLDLRDLSNFSAYTRTSGGLPHPVGASYNFTTGRDYGSFGLPPGMYYVHTALITGHYNEIFDDIVCPAFQCDAQDTITRGTAITIAGEAARPANFVLTPRLSFSKVLPADNAVNLTGVALSWQSHSIATRYEYCVDAVENDSCEASWVPVLGTSVVLNGLRGGTTYYWQARLVNASLNPPTHEANGGVWWSFSTAPGVPSSENDAYAVASYTTLTVTDPGVLSNDNSNGGGVLAASLVADVSNGTLSLSANGGFTYVPDSGFAGVDTFTYRASNSLGAGNVATVTITVNQPATLQPPADLYAAFIDGNLVTLRWTAAAVGPVPSGYAVEGGLNTGEVLASLPTGSSEPVVTFMVPTGAFYVRVHALRGTERSAASNEIRLFVNVPQPPSQPLDLLGIVNGSSLQLSWRNTFAGGAPTGTILDVTGPIAGSLPLPAGETFSVSGVPAGTYSLRVRSANASGVSAESGPLTLTFPGACSGPPLTPENFIVYRIGSTLYATWEPSESGPAVGVFAVSVSGSFSATISTTRRLVSGTVPSGSYSMTLVAANSCGSSGPTPARVVTVP